jgi:hypothetical protein
MLLEYCYVAHFNTDIHRFIAVCPKGQGNLKSKEIEDRDGGMYLSFQLHGRHR